MTRFARLVIVTSALLVGTFQVTSSPASGAPAPAAPQASTYVVRSGDSLVGIAHKLGIRVAVLLQANSLTITSTIYPGDVLVVPAGSPTAATPAASSATAPVSSTTSAGSTTYVVKSGDALASIAQRHGVKLGALVKANDITITSVIVPGQTLRIPPATLPIPAPVPASAPRPQSPPPAASAAQTAPGSSQGLTTYLRAQVGKPYKFFTAGPDTFDCSGLVVAAYAQVGVVLPHQSRALAGVGTAVDWKSAPIVAGDLVFTSSSGDPAAITHVGVALDSTSWIQAVGPGRAVTIAALPASSKIVGVRRLPQP
jgi:LysM repeat protein